MKRLCLFLVIILAVFIQSPVAHAQAIVADHTKADLALIPDGVLSAASNLKVHLRRASVGGNVSDGLDAIQTENAKYDRSHWVFGDRGNPGWLAKVNDFSAFTIGNESDYDIFSMKFCWIDPDAIFAAYRDTLLQLESRYPSKRFIWWTMPIPRDVDGSETNRQIFNDSVRAFAAASGKLLFDIADIEAHNGAGDKKTDGSGHELQQDIWSSDGGHLNAAGARRVASAWWWLMARIGGWDGVTPVQMTSFTASVQGMNTELRWSTATEINNYGFEVERRRVDESLSSGVDESKQWIKIGFVNGAGTSNSPHEYSYSDSRLQSGRYMYRLKQIDNDAAFEYSLSVEVEVGATPNEFVLLQNYPNPFNPTTTIEFVLAEDGFTSLKVFDILGREVITLVDENLRAGIIHQATFDASKLSTGMYFYRLQTKNNSAVKSLLFLK